MSTPIRIAVVGTGAVAKAVARSHSDAGGTVTAIVSRDGGRASLCAVACRAKSSGTQMTLVRGADVVLVCVADRAIAEVGTRLAVTGTGGAPVLHTSGAVPGAELLAQAPGAFAAGSFHPLQSFPAGATAQLLAARIAGTHWFHEGAAAQLAADLAVAWGGSFHPLTPGAKALYHAGAAVVSNHAVALFADATRLFALAGVSPEESRAALASLLEGTAANLRSVGVPQALTGPVARGDAGTVARHLDALRRTAPELAESYCAMVRRTVVVALEKGTIDAAAARTVLDAVK